MTLFAVLLFASLHLGPETPLGPRISGASAFNEDSPAVAWNGNTGLVVWTEQRAAEPPLLRVSPMRADGSLVNPRGTPLFQAWHAHIASNGSTFVLAYSDDAGVHVVSLDENGAPAGAATLLLPPTPDSFTILSNGNGYLFVGSGNVAAAIQDRYALAYYSYQTVHLVITAADGSTTDRVIVSGDDASSWLAIAASDDRLLLSTGNKTLVADADGNVIAPLKQVTDPLAPIDTIGWDGTNFLVISQNHVIRVSPNNDVLDATPATFAKTIPSNLSFTRTGTDTVALWSSNGDILRRTFASDAELFTQPPAFTPEVLSLHAQSPASLEPGLAVWSEGSRDERIVLAINGRTVDVATTDDGDLRDPSVARGGDVVLVFWRNVDSMYARRFALDGSPLDAQPLLVSRDTRILFATSDLTTAAAFDGNNFIVLWSELTNPYIHAARISPSGSLIDATRFEFDPPALQFLSTGMHAVWTGSELLVTWSNWNDFRDWQSPRPPPVTASVALRIDTTAMHATDARVLWQENVVSKRTDLAWNGTNALNVSLHGGCIDATLLATNLKTVRENASVACSETLEHPSVAWNGAEYVVTWTDKGLVRAIRLDRLLQPLDDAPFDVAAGNSPTVAESNEGVVIAYLRAEDDIPRLYTRTLDRIGTVVRRASASRTSR